MNKKKTQLCTLFFGLLMTTCLTSYAQEIVSEFNFQNGKLFSDTDIVECSDGSLLTSFSYYSSDYTESGILICKTTSEGQLVDSLRFDYGHLFSVNGTTDSFVFSSFHWDNADSTEFFNMTFIDADLNITDSISIPVFSGVDPQGLSIDELVFTPENDFVISYWTNLVMHNYWTQNGVFHLMRIGLDGTIVAESETDRMLSPNWSNAHPSDSALTYYSQGFGIFRESPRAYFKIGGYIGTNSNHPWPLIAYFFDEELHLTDNFVYKYIDENTYFDWVGHEHLVPFENNASTDTYLMAAQVRHPDGVYRASMVKYDWDNNPLIVKSVESTTTGGPIKTVVVDENTVYHAHQIHQSTKTLVGLARLDNDLNSLWNINLPGGQSNYAYGQCLKALQNGDVAMAFFTTDGHDGDLLHLYIIHDSYDGTPETTNEKPFVLLPNPVKDRLRLRFSQGNEPEELALYDLQGRLVSNKCNSLEILDMSAMPTGVYMLYVTMKDGKRYQEKIVKE